MKKTSEQIERENKPWEDLFQMMGINRNSTLDDPFFTEKITFELQYKKGSADSNEDVKADTIESEEPNRPKENESSCGLDYYEIRAGKCSFGEVYNGNIVCRNPNCKETVWILDK